MPSHTSRRGAKASRAPKCSRLAAPQARPVLRQSATASSCSLFVLVSPRGAQTRRRHTRGPATAHAPYVAKIKRDDPFRPEDRREIEAACRRIAAAAEFYSSAGWREDAGYLVFHFTTWAKARAMQHWIDRTRIGSRPMPKLGETREEAAEARRAGLAWAFKTGSAAPVVRAFVNARVRGDEELTSFNAACDLAKLLGRSTDEVQRTVRALARMGARASSGVVRSDRTEG